MLLALRARGQEKLIKDGSRTPREARSGDPARLDRRAEEGCRCVQARPASVDLGDTRALTPAGGGQRPERSDAARRQDPEGALRVVKVSPVGQRSPDRTAHGQDPHERSRGAYGGFDVAAGVLSVYSEVSVKDGAITGYVKPLFRDVHVGANGAEEEPKTLGRRLYQGVVSAASKILKNRPRREVATVVTISGRVDRPRFSVLEAVGHLLQNAFFKAILPGFEPQRSPKTLRPSQG